MDKALRLPAIVVGHLILTVPAIAGILLLPFFGLRELGQTLFLSYILAGVVLAWQWYSVALPDKEYRDDGSGDVNYPGLRCFWGD
jgi:hypothetical protein